MGRHALSETMFIPSLPVGGLKCPLHDDIFKKLLPMNWLQNFNESAKVEKKWKYAKKSDR